MGEKARPATELAAPVPRLENGDRLTRAEFERRYAAAPHIKKAELIEGVVYVPSHYGQRSADPLLRSVPPLENGDYLTRVEFERRYAAEPHLKKAELIEGVVHVPLPATLVHSSCHATAIGWLMQFRAATNGVRLLDNATVILDRENEVQPDAALCIAHGGQTRQVKDYLHGAPELVVEVAASSASYDLHDKRRVYRRNGVQEYVVLLALEQQTVWYRLNEGRYDELQPDGDGIYRSQTFPGLWLHSERFWADDPAGLLAVLQLGLSSPEHAAFVAALQGENL